MEPWVAYIKRDGGQMTPSILYWSQKPSHWLHKVQFNASISREPNVGPGNIRKSRMSLQGHSVTKQHPAFEREGCWGLEVLLRYYGKSKVTCPR